MKSIYPKDSGQEYIKKINDVLSVDSRERVFQDYIISPFLQFVIISEGSNRNRIYRIKK